MKEPNFLIAGGVASGTSFLSHAIKDHPEIYLPKILRPECGFFYKENEFVKGKDYYLKRWFSDVTNEKAIGERSSLYIHGLFNDVAKRIYSMYPNIKLIFCLRNPTERAYGNYRFTALSGFETLTFIEALMTEEKRSQSQSGWKAEIQPYLYKLRGCYYDQLEPFFKLFPRENILCIKSEILSKQTELELKKIFKFLNVDENFKYQEQKNHSSPNVKSLYLQCLYRKLFGLKLDTITENFRKEISSSFGAKVVGLNLSFEKKSMPLVAREYLNEYYTVHNEKLSKLLGWDLSDWN